MDKIEKVCLYCGEVFETVRADAKFCSKKHRMKAHRLAKTHIRLVALSEEEYKILKDLLKDCNYLELHSKNNICWGNKNYPLGVFFYVYKDDIEKLNFLFSDRINSIVGKKGIHAWRVRNW